MSIALNEVIVRANQEMRLAKAQLEVEEKGREVAKLQGRVAGYKEIIGIIAGRFHITQYEIDVLGHEPIIVPELSDDDLERLNSNMDTLIMCEEWSEVLKRVEGNIDRMKNELLYMADSSRDLDLCQGKHKGQTIYISFFESIKSEVERRAKEAEKKRKQPSLFEDPNTVIEFPRAAGK